ncbi:unnamed protein product [Arabis nemorensis]|uniref:Uncharacterized protein n=1 Tax=Arabis nemorensis TaxID=586526 RepID=A0A565BT11_9BRAS|nr:unnamed protein product [Arabis nemorensis]
MICVQGLNLWRNKSIEVNDEIFKGYRQGSHEVVTAYDLLDTDRNNFNVTIWYNYTSKIDVQDRRVKFIRVPRSVNLVSNACLQLLQGPGTHMLFDFVKEMPKQETRLRMDMASLIGPIFFTWAILLLFPNTEITRACEYLLILRISSKLGFQSHLHSCDLDLIGLREADASKDHNENAWTRRSSCEIESRCWEVGRAALEMLGCSVGARMVRLANLSVVSARAYRPGVGDELL